MLAFILIFLEICIRNSNIKFPFVVLYMGYIGMRAPPKEVFSYFDF